MKVEYLKIHTSPAHTQTWCDLAQACAACWQVGGMECLRNCAHTLSSRPNASLGLALLQEVQWGNSRRGMQAYNLFLWNNAVAIKHVLSHLPCTSVSLISFWRWRVVKCDTMIIITATQLSARRCGFIYDLMNYSLTTTHYARFWIWTRRVFFYLQAVFNWHKRDIFLKCFSFSPGTDQISGCLQEPPVFSHTYCLRYFSIASKLYCTAGALAFSYLEN